MTPPPAAPALDIDVASKDYDTLADLFLAEGPAPAVKAAPVRAEPRPVRGATVVDGTHRAAAGELSVEGVLAGHLPVMASAWVTQYARHQAELHQEPVVLLRLVAGQALIDLVLPSSMRIPAGVTASPSDLLPDVLTRTAARFRRWMIRVDEPTEPDLLTMGVSGVAILTGADDPAVLASYQTIKSLSLGLTEDAPPLKLVVMGAGHEKAASAEQKLRSCVAKHLSRPLDSTLRIPKISSSLAVQVYRASTTSDLADVIATIHAVPRAQETDAPPTESRMRWAPGPMDARQAARAEAPSNGTSNGAAHANGVAHKPMAAPAEFLPEGLSPLNLACPYAPTIRFATDTHGSLHLVATAELPPADAAQRLLTAAAWTNDHAPLLTAAAPTLKTAADPTLHLLTHDAKQVRGLLDTGIRLHLVATMQVAGQTAVAISSLN